MDSRPDHNPEKTPSRFVPGSSGSIVHSPARGALMRLQRWWTGSLLAGCLVAMTFSGTEGAPARDDRSDAPLDRKDLDSIIHRSLPELIDKGAALYNCGDWAGCYR